MKKELLLCGRYSMIFQMIKRHGKSKISICLGLIFLLPLFCMKTKEKEPYIFQKVLGANINDNKEYAGNQMITVAAPLDQLPVFAKAGTLEEL